MYSPYAFSGTYVRDGQATKTIYKSSLSLLKGATYVIETANLTVSPGCTGPPDTVLRLATRTFGVYTHVTSNDDGSPEPLASKISFTVPTDNETYNRRSYDVIVHSYNTDRCGTFDLKLNGYTISSSKDFGGKKEIFQVSDGSSIHTSFKNGGGFGHQMLVLNSSSSSGSLAYYEEQNVSSYDGELEYLNTNYNYGSSSTKNIAVFHSAKYTLVNDDIQVVHNVGSDFDGDGLSNMLESEIGTCDWAIGSFCGTLSSVGTEDSDMDGLSDSEELFGIQNNVVGNVQAAPLGLWGASPVKKDVFMQINRDSTYQDVTTDSAFADGNSANNVSSFYKSGPLSAYNNPDGTPGINIHFDVNTTNDTVIHSSQNPIAMFDSNYGTIATGRVDNSNPNSPLLTCRHNATVYKRYVSDFRKRFMHGYCYGDHNGSSGVGYPSFVARNAPATIAHELGHSFGISHGGETNINGTPHYKSSMNYMFDYAGGFSEGINTTILNGRSLNEQIGLGVGVDASYLKGDTWKLTVSNDGQKVDWNRNGYYDTQNVMAPVTMSVAYMKWPSTFNRTQTIVHSNAGSFQVRRGSPPSLARYKYGSINKVYTFSAVQHDNFPSQLQFFRYQAIDVNSKGLCLQHVGISIESGKCGFTSFVGDLSAQFVSAVSHKGRMYVAINQNNNLYVYSYIVNHSNGSLKTDTRQFELGPYPIRGNPDMASSGRTLKLLFVHNNDNKMYILNKRADDTWAGLYGQNRVSNTNPSIVYNDFGANIHGSGHISYTDENDNLKILTTNTGFDNDTSYSPDYSKNLNYEGSPLKAYSKSGIAILKPSQGSPWNMMIGLQDSNNLLTDSSRTDALLGVRFD